MFAKDRRNIKFVLPLPSPDRFLYTETRRIERSPFAAPGAAAGRCGTLARAGTFMRRYLASNGDVREQFERWLNDLQRASHDCHDISDVLDALYGEELTHED